MIVHKLSTILASLSFFVTVLFARGRVKSDFYRNRNRKYEESGEIENIPLISAEQRSLARSRTISTASSCDTDEKSVVIDITTDNFGSETTWQLLNISSSTIIYEASGYEDSTAYSESFCISDCHEFTISDSFGDGIGAPGSLSVTVDGEAVESSFTGKELKRVLGCAECSSEETHVVIDIATDEGCDDTEWSIENSLGEVIAKGSNYQEKSTYSEEFCLSDDGCKIFSITRVWDSSYNLTVDDGIVASGTRIWDDPEITTFACPPTISPAPSTANPTAVPWCDGGETSVKIFLTTDNNNAGSNWEVKNLESDLVVANGSGYDPASSYVIPLCVGGSICHSFTIYQTWENPYELEVNHVVIASGEKIWNEGDTTEFGCAPTVSPAPSLLPSFIPTHTPCGGGEIQVVVELNTDDNGDNTKWEIVHNGNDEIVESGSGYEENQSYQIGMCLSNAIEYTFTIEHHWSNLYLLKVDGEIVISGNQVWGTAESTVFGSFSPSISPRPSPYPTSHPPSEFPSEKPSYSNSCVDDENFILLQLQTDNSVDTMKWEIKNVETNEIIERGQNYEPSSDYVIKTCVPKEVCHSFTIYNYWTNPYYLSVNNILVATGSEIWGVEGQTTEFECVTESPSLSPTRAPCETDDLEVLVILDTDGNGDQTRWEIVHNRNGEIIESGSGYEDNTAYEIGRCLSTDIEYTFSIFNHGSNFYYLKLDDEILASGNQIWGAGESTVFGSFSPTISPVPSPYPSSLPPSEIPSEKPSYGNSCTEEENAILLELQTDQSVTTMKWEIKNVETDVIFQEGTGYDPNTSYVIQLCTPKESCHSFTIYNYWTNPYYLSLNNKLLATGNEIWGATGQTTEFACITESPSVSPTRAPCETDYLDVMVILDTDIWGAQTRWEIVQNRNGEIIESGSGYEANQAYEIEHCLSNKVEYTFTIYNNWNNEYKLKVDGEILANGNEIWGTGESTVFGSFSPTISPIPSPYPTSHPTSPRPTTHPPSLYPSNKPSYSNWCSSDENNVLLELQTDTWVDTMSWTVSNDQGVVIADGSGYDPSSTYAIKLCFPMYSCHSFTIYNYWTYPYYLKVNNVEVGTGKEIWGNEGETKEFGCPIDTPSPELLSEDTPAPVTAPNDTPAPVTAPKDTPAPVVAPKDTPAPVTFPTISPTQLLTPAPSLPSGELGIFQIISTVSSATDWCIQNSGVVEVVACNDSDKQKWRIDEHGHIISMADDKCMMKRKKIWVKVGACSNSVKRSFAYNSFDNTIRWKYFGKQAFAISGDAPSHKAGIMILARDIWFYTQQWLLHSTTSNYITPSAKYDPFEIRSTAIKATDSPLCLEPSSFKKKARIFIEECDGSDNQRWVSNANGIISTYKENRSWCIRQHGSDSLLKLFSCSADESKFQFIHDIFDNTIGQTSDPTKVFTIEKDKAVAGKKVKIAKFDDSFSTQKWSIVKT